LYFEHKTVDCSPGIDPPIMNIEDPNETHLCRCQGTGICV